MTVLSPRPKDHRKVRQRPVIPLTEEQQALAMSCYRMACLQAIRWKPFLGEDAFSIAQEALCRAAGVFDPGRGCRFITLAQTYVINALRQERHRRASWQADPRCRRTQELPSWSGELLQEDSDTGLALDLAALLDCLLPRYRRIIQMRFLEGLKFSEIGKRERISKTRAEQISRRAIAQLRIHARRLRWEM